MTDDYLHLHASHRVELNLSNKNRGIFLFQRIEEWALSRGWTRIQGGRLFNSLMSRVGE